MIGREISHYRIESLLGDGGMGEVWLARDLTLDRAVAVKRVRTDQSTRPGARRRLLAEARALARIEDPHVVAIHDVMEDGDEVYLVMQYMERGSLADLGHSRQGSVSCDPATPTERLDGGAQIPSAEILRWVAQAARGLEAAHASGIVHRDVKPANLFVDDKRRVRVGDFGLAKRQDPQDGTQSLYSVGTPAYMSPEQIKGQDLDARSDIFSLGVTLFALLAGGLPFEGLDRGRPAPALAGHVPDLPPAVSDLVASMLELDPERRPARAVDVARTLEQIAEGKSISPEQVSSRSGDKSRRRVGLLVAMAVVMVLAGWTVWRLVEGTTDATGPPAGSTYDVVTLPFVARGDGDSGTFSELMDFVLSGIEEVRTPHARTVGQALGDGADFDVDDGIRLCEHLDADRFVLGTLLRQGNQVQASASLYDRNGELVADLETVRASGEDAAIEIADRVGLELVARVLDRPTDDFTHAAIRQSTTSPRALMEFVDGQMAVRQWDLSNAVEHFRAAATIDTSFGLAYLKLYEMGAWFEDASIAEPAYRAVLRHRSEIPLRYRPLVDALQAEHESRIDDAESALRAILHRYPDDTTTRTWLAMLMYSHNVFRGRSVAECLPLLERLHREEPGYLMYQVALQWVWLSEGDVDTFEDWYRESRGAPLDADDEYLIACIRGDRERMRQLRASGDIGRQPYFVTLLVGSVPDNHFALRDLLLDALQAEDHSERPLLLTSLAATEMGLGRFESAWSALERVEAEYENFVLLHRAQLLGAPLDGFDAPTDLVADTIAGLENWDPRRDPLPTGDRLGGFGGNRMGVGRGHEEPFRLYALGLLHAVAGHLDAAAEYADRMDALELGGDLDLLRKSLVAGIRGRVEFERGDFVACLRRLDQGAQACSSYFKYFVFSSRGNERFLRAQALQALGRSNEAIGWLETAHEYLDSDRVFVAWAHLDLARIYRDRRESERSRRQLDAFVRLMADREPQLDGWVDEARTEFDDTAQPEAIGRRPGAVTTGSVGGTESQVSQDP